MNVVLPPILVGDNNPLYSYGMHFCPTCKNLMRPFLGSQQLLDFICDKCGKKQTVDYSKRTGDDSLLYSKELQAGINIDIFRIEEACA